MKMGDFPIQPAESKPASGTPGGVTAKADPILTVGTKKIKKSQYKALVKLAKDNGITIQSVLKVVNSNSRGLVLQLRLEKNPKVKNISAISALPDLQVLKLYSTGVKTINALSKCTKLWELSLGDTKVTDLKPLRGLKNLEVLYLWKTSVTDITPLRNLPKLRELYLNGNTSITNIKVTLRQIKTLRKLNVLNTKQAVQNDAKTLRDEAQEEKPPRTIILAVK
jgi:internalin A